MPDDKKDLIIEKLPKGDPSGGSLRVRTADGKTFTMPVGIVPSGATPKLKGREPRRRDRDIAGQVRRLAAVGLSKTAVASCVRIQSSELNRLYLKDFELGRRSMAETVASAAMEQVRSGNPQMIMFMAKTRLGWTETNVLEHTGTVNAVVSAKPLSREEFEARYLADNRDGDAWESTQEQRIIEVNPDGESEDEVSETSDAEPESDSELGGDD